MASGLYGLHLLMVAIMFRSISSDPITSPRYSLHPRQLPFEQAVEACSPDGVLATFITQRDLSEVLTLLSESPPPVSQSEITLWVGLRRLKKQCVVSYLTLRGFRWIHDSSQEAEVMQWWEEPKETCTSLRCAALRVELQGTNVTRWGLVQVTCKTEYQFICERRLIETPAAPETSEPQPEPEPATPKPPEPARPTTHTPPYTPGTHTPDPELYAPAETNNTGLQEPGSDPGSDLSSDPGADPGSDLGSDHGSDLGSDPGSDLGSDPGSDPGIDPGSDLGSDPGSDRGSDLGSDRGSDLGSDLGSDPGSDLGSEPGMVPVSCEIPKDPTKTPGIRSFIQEDDDSRTQVECWSLHRVALQCSGHPLMWRRIDDSPVDFSAVCRTCELGFQRDALGDCADIDECHVDKPCRHLCLNSAGSFRCVCSDENGKHHNEDSATCKNMTRGEDDGLLSGILFPVLVAVAAFVVLVVIVVVTVKCCLMRRSKKRAMKKAEKMVMKSKEEKDSFLTANEKTAT